jgi:parallel beta-helix repeat protein
MARWHALSLGVVVLLGAQSTASQAATLHVPRDFPTIQSAVDAASPGDIIQVGRGTYSENVLVQTDDIRLHGQNAVLDGTGLNGLGFGIHVLNADGVTISGFIVQRFEVGIVVEDSEQAVIHRNETRFNLSATPALRDGIQLDNADYATVTANSAHHNGHNGITLRNGSSNNLLRANAANDNGTQVAANFAGCGVQLQGGGNDHNVFAANATHGNGWGLQVSGPSVGNHFLQNRAHANARAGVAFIGGSSGNRAAQNDARGNGLADQAPSGTVDLFDALPVDNEWARNLGTSNF